MIGDPIRYFVHTDSLIFQWKLGEIRKVTQAEIQKFLVDRKLNGDITDESMKHKLASYICQYCRKQLKF